MYIFKELKFEDLITLIKSVITIFSVAVVFIKARVSKYDLILKDIDTLAGIVILKLSSNQIITQIELESIIKSHKIKNKLPDKAYSVNEILDKCIELIENNPFIEKDRRRLLLEKIIFLRKSKSKTLINFYRFTKENQTQLFSVILILIIAIVLLKPNQWAIFNKISPDLQQLVIEIGIGIILSLSLFFLIRLSNKIFNGKFIMDEPNFEFSSFNFFPSYHNEYINFNSTSKKLIFNLINANYGSEKKGVESDPGFFGLGIIKFYKHLKFYEITFQENSGLKLAISLRKGSLRNGLIDYDYMEYKLFKDKEKSIHKIFISPIKDNIDITKYEDFKLEEYNNEKFYISYGIQQIKIILTLNKKLFGLEINGQLFTLN